MKRSFLPLTLILTTSVLFAADENENLDSLSLKDGKLTATAPLVGQKDDYPEFTREFIQVQWRSEDPIYLVVLKPIGVVKPPVILHLYGYPTEIKQFMDVELSKQMVAKGFAAVGFVSALTGHRYHSRPMREWFVSELKESLVTTVHDVQMIMNYLDSRGDVDMTRLGMFGEGSGGTVAILAAVTDPRIKALDLLDPWGDWPDWFAKSKLVPDDERPDYLKPEFLNRIAPLDPIRWFPKITVPVRFEYLTKPTITPQMVRDKMQSVAPPQTVIVPYEKGLAAFRASKGADFFDWIKSQAVFAKTAK